MRSITFSKLVVPPGRYCPAAWLLLGLLAGPLVPAALGQGTGFTYQGRLTDGSGPANGNYDFRFRLAADPLGNNLVAGPILTNGVAVSGGLFMVALDFGSVFTGSNYWLQIDVRTNGAASYSTLTPLQALTPTPYAIFAGGASNLLGAVPTAQLSGTIASPQLAGAYSNPLSFNNAANQFSGAFNGNGGALSNVNAAALGGLAASNFWQTSGNTGTSPAVNFLGTSDNQPLELRVNGQRVLRLTPNSNGGPNLLGGSTANLIAPGVVGGVLIGGGSISYFGAPYTNSIASDFDFVGGGGGNSIGTNSPFSTIVGGTGNQIGANNSDAFIGGGTGNQIGDWSGFSTISGGLVSQIGTNSSQSTIGGGNNIIGSNASETTIGGGGGNRILDNSGASTIAGGSSNQIQTNSTAATIAGGTVNHIQSFSDYSFIGGGNRNSIVTNSQYATIGGGNFNTIQGAASYAAIVGGNNNTNDGGIASIGGGEANMIQFAADHAVIAGGGNNTIVGSLTLPVYDTIGGGQANAMQTNSIYCVVGGGRSNLVTAGAAFSTISGGTGNTIFLGAENATIAGGSNNVASANGATVVGGLGNSALSPGSVAMGINSTAHGFASIAMGLNTGATGNNSLAAGYVAQATNTGVFVWSDSSSPINFSSLNDNSFNVRASGGVRLVTSGAGLSLDGPLGITSGTISGNGGLLTNVNASTLGGIASSNFWQLGGNNVASGQFLGCTNNQPFEIRVNGQRALRLEPTATDTSHSNIVNVIGGSGANFVAGGIYGATIAGGGALVYGSAGRTNAVLADFGTVGGGYGNTVLSPEGTIGGGDANTVANGQEDTIAGGTENTIQNGDFGTVGGGIHNTLVQAFSSTISGGNFNTIQTANSAMIGGGNDNTILTNAGLSVIGGGGSNTNQNGVSFAVIGGGQLNQVSGPYGTVPGGDQNSAGTNSFAAGHRARANHTGSFVWADSTDADLSTTGANQFLIRAGGGVGIGTTTPQAPFHVSEGSAGSIAVNANSSAVFERPANNYVSLLGPTSSEVGIIFGNPSPGPNNGTDGGVIFNHSSTLRGLQFRTGTNITRMVIQNSGNVGIGTTSPTNILDVSGNISCSSNVFAHGVLLTSDRNAKENFVTLNPQTVLAKVASLPLTEWNYKGDDPQTKHVGPMAQDFRAAFGLNGNDDGHISVVDESGVALAAIQGLNQKLTEELQRRDTENAALKQRLERLEQLLERQSHNP